MPLSAIQPAHYEQLLEHKVAQLLPAFQSLGASNAQVFPSPSTGFRLRAEFRIWHSGDNLDYVMFRRGDPKTPVVVESFPIAAEAIQRLMPQLRDYLALREPLRRKLFQIEFLSTLAGDMLVTLIYHRPLDDSWQAEADALAAHFGIQLVGRSRREKRVIGRDWVNETLTIRNKQFEYRQPEQAFSQPNGRVNEAMISWTMDAAETCSGDLLELYCGVGNFTLPLAACFDRVIATEMSKPATAAAEMNRQANNIENIEFARMSAEDMTSALAGERPFRRLAHLHQPLADYALKTLFVDPPRAGLDPATLQLAGSFENVIYISCNPHTLLENIASLASSHRIERLAFFDQFPYTDHMECGVLLRVKG